jgi:hypothetical protein
MLFPAVIAPTTATPIRKMVAIAGLIARFFMT